MSRFCLLQDDDCHWYLVPVELKPKFQSMADNARVQEDFERFDDEFGKFRCGGGPSNYSFENPEEI